MLVDEDEEVCAKLDLTMRSSSAFCLRPCSSSAAARASLCDMAVFADVVIAELRVDCWIAGLLSVVTLSCEEADVIGAMLKVDRRLALCPWVTPAVEVEVAAVDWQVQRDRWTRGVVVWAVVARDAFDQRFSMV